MSGQASLDGSDMSGSSEDNSTSGENLLLQTGTGMQAARATFLILFLLIGFVGNCVLVATIAQSGRLKNTTLNLFILSVASVNLLDSLLNIPLVLGASIAEEWTYGSFVCQLNAFCMQLTSIVMVTTLTMMTLDRFISLHSLRSHNTNNNNNTCMNTARTNGLIVASWTYGLALSLVILIGVVSAEPYKARYLCSPSAPVNVVYICFVSVFGYILPVLALIVMFVYVIRICVLEKIREDTETGKTYVDDGTSLRTSRVWTEINATKLIGVLVLLWCIFEGPFLLLVTVDQFENSKELRQFSRRHRADRRHSFKYAWQIDTCFTWLRLSYVMALPVVSVFWGGDVWNKIKGICNCCDTGDVIAHAQSNRRERNENHAFFKRETKSKPRDLPMIKAESRASIRSKKSNGKEKEIKKKPNDKEKEKERTLSLSNSSVPVLFATENGLHYENTGFKKFECSDSDNDVTEEPTETTDTTLMTSRKCDVFGSGFVGGVTGEDTSDYDSQIEDPFPLSDSVSPKSVKSQQGKDSPKNSTLDQELFDPHIKQNGVINTNSETVKNSRNPGKKKARSKDTNEAKLDNSDDLLSMQVNTDPDAKKRHDSGTGSLGTKKKKKSKESNPNLSDQLNGNDISEVDYEKVTKDVEDNAKAKKRKKKKKRKVHILDTDIHDSITENPNSKTNQEDCPISEPRKLPKLNLQLLKTDRESHDTSIFTHSLSTQPPYRQLSDNTAERSVDSSVDSGIQSERLCRRHLSSEPQNAATKRVQSARPVPSPRKSLLAKQQSARDMRLSEEKTEGSDMHLFEGGIKQGYIEAGIAFE